MKQFRLNPTNKLLLSDVEQHIIESIKQGGDQMDAAIAALYSQFGLWPIARNIALRNQGTTTDAEDLFQEALTRMVFNIQQGRFDEKSKIKTYFYSISDHVWKDILRKRKMQFKIQSNYALNEKNEQLQEPPDLSKAIQILKNTIGCTCVDILQKWALSHELDGIAEALGFKNANVVSQKKHKCLKKLAQILEENPQLRQAIKNSTF